VIRNSFATLKSLDGARILLYGGTGFIGRWITSSLIHASNEMKLNLEIEIVTRDTANARSVIGQEFSSRIKFKKLDLSTEAHSIEAPFDIAIHGATSSVPQTGSKNSFAVHNASINATNSILNAAEKFMNVPRVINLSSGAVFNPQDMSTRNLSEESTYRENASGYSATKIEIEKRLDHADACGTILNTDARLFAFFGPHLAMNEHFAIGNFMQNSLNNEAIELIGNPLTRRSYLYVADLISMIINLFPLSSIKKLNLGNDEPVTMEELAKFFSNRSEKGQIKLSESFPPPTNYVPEVEIMRSKVAKSPLITLEAGCNQWEEWLRLKEQI
jgi:dTDP-glucose 4,6-dehydratase